MFLASACFSGSAAWKSYGMDGSTPNVHFRLRVPVLIMILATTAIPVAFSPPQ